MSKLTTIIITKCDLGMWKDDFLQLKFDEKDDKISIVPLSC
jgi:hypothetical protein